MQHSHAIQGRKINERTVALYELFDIVEGNARFVSVIVIALTCFTATLVVVQKFEPEFCLKFGELGFCRRYRQLQSCHDNGV